MLLKEGQPVEKEGLPLVYVEGDVSFWKVSSPKLNITEYGSSESLAKLDFFLKVGKKVKGGEEISSLPKEVQSRIKQASEIDPEEIAK